jgi:hypothetical protein
MSVQSKKFNSWWSSPEKHTLYLKLFSSLMYSAGIYHNDLVHAGIGALEGGEDGVPSRKTTAPQSLLFGNVRCFQDESLPASRVDTVRTERSLISNFALTVHSREQQSKAMTSSNEQNCNKRCQQTAFSSRPDEPPSCTRVRNGYMLKSLCQYPKAVTFPQASLVNTSNLSTAARSSTILTILAS